VAEQQEVSAGELAAVAHRTMPTAPGRCRPGSGEGFDSGRTPDPGRRRWGVVWLLYGRGAVAGTLPCLGGRAVLPVMLCLTFERAEWRLGAS
jgi:hypothetical protein